MFTQYQPDYSRCEIPEMPLDLILEAFPNLWVSIAITDSSCDTPTAFVLDVSRELSYLELTYQGQNIQTVFCSTVLPQSIKNVEHLAKRQSEKRLSFQKDQNKQLLLIAG